MSGMDDYPRYFILDGHTPVHVKDVLEWGNWFEGANNKRRIKRTVIDDIAISTVFLGLNHNFSSDGPPQIFETLVFNGPLDGEMYRYATWDEAVAGHKTMVARVREERAAK